MTHRRGVAHHFARLSEAEVIALRLDARRGLSYRALARKYEVSRQTAWNIANRTTWKHLP